MHIKPSESLLSILCTFSLRPVSRGNVLDVLNVNIEDTKANSRCCSVFSNATFRSSYPELICSKTSRETSMFDLNFQQRCRIFPCSFTDKGLRQRYFPLKLSYFSEKLFLCSYLNGWIMTFKDKIVKIFSHKIALTHPAGIYLLKVNNENTSKCIKSVQS